MLKIRLQRVGRKHDPSYRVILTDSHNAAQTGRVIELMGSYDPRRNVSEIKADRVTHWIAQGAKTSDTLHNLLISKKIIEGKKINVLPKKTPPVKEEPVVAAAPAKAVEEAKEELVAEAPVETTEETVTSAEEVADAEPASEEAAPAATA